MAKQPFLGVGYAATAYAIMQKTFDAGIAAGCSPKGISLAIQHAYPWKKRRGWRYKAWLAARREFFELHKLPGLRSGKTIQETAEDNNLLDK